MTSKMWLLGLSVFVGIVFGCSQAWLQDPERLAFMHLSMVNFDMGI